MAAVQYGLTHLEAGRAAVLVVFELIAAVLSSAGSAPTPSARTNGSAPP